MNDIYAKVKNNFEDKVFYVASFPVCVLMGKVQRESDHQGNDSSQ